jgi:hypothetical protein
VAVILGQEVRMMRSFNMDQQKLFQQYSKLSKNIVGNSRFFHCKEINIQNVFDLITDYGIWRLPIAKIYGGQGLNWQDCIAAFYGLLSHDVMMEIIPSLIPHISALYFISNYATESIRQEYLPRLIKCEIAHLIIPKKFDSLLGELNLNKRINKINLDNKILIHLEKTSNEMIFYISESNAHSIFIKGKLSSDSTIITENEFTKNNKDTLVLCDLINFIKLIYNTVSYENIYNNN